MVKELSTIYKDILQKQEVLYQAAVILKKEFIGIDNLIDEVVYAVSSWYLYPNLQESPIIINLWGLTGVGKSSLVCRLVQLLDYENKFYHFNLGNSDTYNWNLQKAIGDICENANGYPIILAFDEFQNIRTLDEEGRENKVVSRIIWQLLDTGKFYKKRESMFYYSLINLIQKLQYMLNAGVRVAKGKVITKKMFFIEYMDLKRKHDESGNGEREKLNLKNVLFVPKEYYIDIYRLTDEKFFSSFEVKQKLMALNGYETILFLKDTLNFFNSPKIVDCSKGLIFVLGNLDEVYTMSDNYNPDMDADEFHKQSLKINVPEVKEALKNRFRNEQIARLGNKHIIYPAFSKNSFKKIIELELNKIVNKVYQLQKVNIQFDPSIHDLIYKEGVYPTQGTRPIFTTIHQTISTKLGRTISEMILKNLKVSMINFSVKTNFIIIDYYFNNKKIHTLSIQQQLSLEPLRKNKKDDYQAIMAVHESGHAVISIVLLHTIPEKVCSSTVENNTGGFSYIKVNRQYVSRKEIVNRLAMFLSGYVAEKIVFGDDNITSAAQEDIERATNFITRMLKKCGMGKLPAAYHVKGSTTRNFLYDTSDKMTKEAEKMITKALTLTEKTLIKQEKLLLKMANYLSDNRELNKEQLRKMVDRYAYNIDSKILNENSDHLFYRKHLKKKVTMLEKEPTYNHNGCYKF